MLIFLLCHPFFTDSFKVMQSISDAGKYFVRSEVDNFIIISFILAYEQSKLKMKINISYSYFKCNINPTQQKQIFVAR